MKPTHPHHSSALDGVDPPEQWDDILFRAARPDVALLPDVPARRSPRPFLAAAAAVVMVGLVAALVLGGSAGRDPKVGTLAGEPVDGGPAVTREADGLPVDPEGLETGNTTTTVAGTQPDQNDGQGQPSVILPPGTQGGNDQTGTTAGMGGSATTLGSPANDPVLTPQTTPDGDSGDNGPVTTTTAAQQPSTTVPPLSIKPAGMPWGRSWVLGSMTDAAGDRSLGTDRAIVLDATTEGRISVTVCNKIGGTGSVVDGKLVLTMGPSTEMSCGQPLDGHEAWLAQLLSSSPTVNATGNILVLSNGTKRAEFDALVPSEGAQREVEQTTTTEATITESTKPNEAASR